MKTIGLWSGHDASACVVEDGKIFVHLELERFLREKEPAGNAEELLMSQVKILDYDDVVSALPSEKTKHSSHKIKYYGHHQCHAANAFFSSNFEESVVVTLDGGGIDAYEDGKIFTSACSIWDGIGTKITNPIYLKDDVNIGGLWTRCTRYIFKLQSGWPMGHQAGTVMAMAALGKPKYLEDFRKMLRQDLRLASFKPSNQPRGAYVGNDPVHPYLDKWASIASKSEEEKFNVAASLQTATEEQIDEIFETALNGKKTRNVCIAGGVALNSVAVGKLSSKFGIDIFIPHVPYDAGLCLGAAQYHHHHVNNIQRVAWNPCPVPSNGVTYSNREILNAVAREDLTTKLSSDEEVLNLVSSGHIVSVFQGKAESGRRALGNRSIVADPRRGDMKEKINDKVKHRQWFRPFAPSILEEYQTTWLDSEQKSPYMSFVAKFHEDKKALVPAVVHFDGTGRYQTVMKTITPWWHSFITKWNNVTGVPILLNTSFNDSEPIVETPQHAVDCYIKTDIDYLYFADERLLVSKK